ncbi:MAG TPA: hypothetical protein VM165_08730, partial [Planctomycetaceae bacterium]|nr:hypothetical protein [Planctomycetaceae bacterium]
PMLGLWKLGAMSAVIGAGVVVVWQAQLGLQPQIEAGVPTAPALIEVAPVEAATSPTPIFAEADATLTPIRAVSQNASRQSANASVPPETKIASSDPAADFGPGPALDLAAPSAADNRYSRGLDFRRLPDSDAESNNAPAAKPQTSRFPPEEDDQWTADTAPKSLPAMPLLPVPEQNEPASPSGDRTKAPSSIQQINGEAPPASTNPDDPFADSAPPDLGPMPAANSPTATPPAAESFDPFGTEPEPAPKPKPKVPAVNDDAPSLGPAKNLKADAPANTPPPLPTDLDEFNPFPNDKPGEKEPADARPARLPLNLDEPAEPAGIANEPAPLDKAAPLSNRTESRSRLPNPSDLAPKSESPASGAPKPLTDSLLGDGELPATTLRSMQEPRLTIEKIAPAKATLGQPLIYSVIVKNTGNSPAGQVTVEDRIPKGTRLVGTAPRAELVEKRLMWKLGTIPPGEERKIAIKVIPEEEGAIGSVARVNFVAEVAAEIVVTAPKLKIAVVSPQEVKVGSTAEMVFTLSNPGNGDATNVIIRSLIPDGFQHPAGNDLEYSLGTLAPKESREVRLELTAVKPGRLIHKTVVTADGNVGTESQTPVEVIGEQLLLTRSGHNRVYLGRPSVYTNTVTNEGQRALDRVQITETVPAGFDFVQASRDGRYEAGQRTITWTVGPIAPGAKIDVSATLAAKSLGEFSSEITAQGQTGTTASVRPTITIEGFPSIAVEPLSEQKLVAIGEQVTSRIQLRNKGTATAKNVGLTITLPPELKLVSAKGPGQHRQEAGRVVFDPVDEVLASGTAEFQLVFEAQSAGDSRLEMQISAEHLKRPVRHEESVQVVGN